jgi:hypothetical protein
VGKHHGVFHAREGNENLQFQEGKGPKDFQTHQSTLWKRSWKGKVLEERERKGVPWESSHDSEAPVGVLFGCLANPVVRAKTIGQSEGKTLGKRGRDIQLRLKVSWRNFSPCVDLVEFQRSARRGISGRAGLDRCLLLSDGCLTTLTGKCL